MVLDSEDPSSALLGIGNNGILVDGLDGERVQDADVDSMFGLKLGLSLQSLVKSDAGCDDQHAVRVRLGENLGFANLEKKFLQLSSKYSECPNSKHPNSELK